jgi:predicted negative regulator of RcsB-dependent stress response
MAYDLQEQEQIATFKAWWDKYGNFILTVVTVVLFAFAAYNGWRWYERNQAAQAAAVYEQFSKALAAGDTARAQALAGTIIEQYGGTVYAPMAALIAAKAYHEAGDLKAAKAQLVWVIEKSHRAEFVPIARLRLAGVLLDEKAYDDALKTLSGEVPATHAAAFADRRGDILVAQNRIDEARAAYREALAKADAQHPLRPLIQLKLDALPAPAAS